jgi:uroporphyrinogen decarboxylase
MAEFCDMVHSYNAKVKYHSCGSIYSIIPDLIEVGVDILNPIQTTAADMDPYKIKKEFGNRLCLHGAVDIQELLPNGTVEDVETAVRGLISGLGYDGGYIIAGTHTIQSDAKTENIVALVETAKKERFKEARL